MIEDYHKYSYMGLYFLCREHEKEILDHKASPKILENRRVRFINPEGHFDYAKFGDFYFSDRVMMLITRDIKYTAYHQPDKLRGTLWSTVPVIYAGIETFFRDDENRDIFTGDVVTYKNYTSFVRFWHAFEIPGLAGDNCEVLFDTNLPKHVEGTVFYNISKSLYEEFTMDSFWWPLKAGYIGSKESDAIRERAFAAKDKPVFQEDLDIHKKKKPLIYNGILKELSKDDIVTYFIGDNYENEIGVLMNDIYADNFPETTGVEDYSIMLHDDVEPIEMIRKAVSDFLLYAHNHPEQRFVLCDFKKSLSINNKEEKEIAAIFSDWYEYKIQNVVLPFWIFNNIIN